MNKNELTKEVKKNLDFAKKCYENDQNFSTMFIIGGNRKGEVARDAIIVGNQAVLENRNKVVFFMGIRAGIEMYKKLRDSVDSIYMISEAWFSTELKNKGKKLKFDRPSLDPKRKEGIISSGLTRDNKTIVEMYEIKRSMDLKSGKFKVEFQPYGEKENSLKAEAPLLKHFWEGVNLTEKMFSDFPPVIAKIVEQYTVEKTLGMFINVIEGLRSKE